VSSEDADSSRRRSTSTSGSEKSASLSKRTLDETENDEPTVPGTAPINEAQPELKPQRTDFPDHQPMKKRKSTSSDDEIHSSLTGALMVSPSSLLNIPTLPNFDGYLNYAPAGPLFPLFPLVMPNQFPNICAPDFEMRATAASSVNIEQPSNEIFQSSKTGYFQPP